MKYCLRELSNMFPNGADPINTPLMVYRLAQKPFVVEVQVIAALS